MQKTELDRQSKVEIEDNSSLKGTLISVFLVGFVIVAFWVAVYSVFSSRF